MLSVKKNREINPLSDPSTSIKKKHSTDKPIKFKFKFQKTTNFTRPKPKCNKRGEGDGTHRRRWNVTRRGAEGRGRTGRGSLGRASLCLDPVASAKPTVKPGLEKIDLTAVVNLLSIYSGWGSNSKFFAVNTELN